jgi:hypothetical protein
VRGAALGLAVAAIVPVVLLNLVFPEHARQPFSFASYVSVPLWCAGALLLTRRLPSERPFRVAVLAYLTAVTAVWLLPNPLGDNSIRLLSLFGGPLLLAILLSRRPRVPIAIVVIMLGASAYWQVIAAARELWQSAGDPSTRAAYYEPLADWLRTNGGERARIEVPTTLNSWEAAYLAPEFNLARGWLRQLDRTRSSIFYEDRLTRDRYHRWLRRNGVRYVALADAPPHQFARDERRLVLRGPGYLEPRWSSEHWRVYEVADPRPLVQDLGYGEARLVSMRPEWFSLRVGEPGRFKVLVRGSPFWELTRGEGCVGLQGRWASVRADEPGLVRVGMDFSVGDAWRAAAGSSDTC